MLEKLRKEVFAVCLIGVAIGVTVGIVASLQPRQSSAQPAASVSERTACEDAIISAGELADQLYEEPELMDHQLNAVEFPPLSICKSADEWLDAARANPEALGFTHADAVDATSLYLRCQLPTAGERRVCQDAEAWGLFD